MREGKKAMKHEKGTIGFLMQFLVMVFLVLGHPFTLNAADQLSPPRSTTLWKVDSAQNSVYILGSIHVLKKENYPLNEKIYQAFDESPNAVFEVDLDGLTSPEVQMEVLTTGFYTDGRNLEAAISPESYAFVKTQLKDRGMNIEQFQPMKPWMIATTIMTLELQKLGFEMNQGVDKHLFDRAKATGKHIQGLETIEYQLGLFDNLSPKTQELFLLQTLGELAIFETQINNVVEAWTQGRTEGLEGMLDNMRQFPEVYEALITKRNKNWIPHIETFLEQKEKYLIVVGTLHVLGEEGLLAMLKKKGYIIEQM